jgi:hypothetical protein
MIAQADPPVRPRKRLCRRHYIDDEAEEADPQEAEEDNEDDDESGAVDDDSGEAVVEEGGGAVAEEGDDAVAEEGGGAVVEEAGAIAVEEGGRGENTAILDAILTQATEIVKDTILPEEEEGDGRFSRVSCAKCQGLIAGIRKDAEGNIYHQPCTK